MLQISQDELLQTDMEMKQTDVTNTLIKCLCCELLKSNQIPVCWGSNAQNLEISTEFSQICVGYRYNCGITSSNQNVVCWGRNDQGQSDVTNPSDAYDYVGCGYQHVCAIRSDTKRLDCWGNLFDNN